MKIKGRFNLKALHQIDVAAWFGPNHIIKSNLEGINVIEEIIRYAEMHNRIYNANN